MIEYRLGINWQRGADNHWGPCSFAAGITAPNIYPEPTFIYSDLLKIHILGKNNVPIGLTSLYLP